MKLDICEIKKMLKTMCGVTVYSERNQIYLKKHFREQLGSNIEISINRKNKKEMIIKETGEGGVKRIIIQKRL